MRNLFSFLSLLLVFFVACDKQEDVFHSWEVYKGDPGSTGYSSLKQINRENVDQLEVAWIYKSGFFSNSGSQCNPIVIKGNMYLITPGLKVASLNAATGALNWLFDPFEGQKIEDVNRGVTYWENGSDKRIFFTPGFHLYALNADTGKPIPDFGIDGKVDMREGINDKPEKLSVKASSPGVIFKNKIILGSTVGNGTPGDVRAYNVKTGKLEWIFHTLPRPGEFGYDTWDKKAWEKAGGANNWGGMSLDEERGMVYFGTATGNPDFYSVGTRGAGEHLFGNSIIGLNANTGERIWHFQTIKHDLWDYDIPAPPVLVKVKKEGVSIDAIAQVTKQGFTFVLDRDSGASLFPIENRKVPQSTIRGEETWPTQPFPTLPEPFTRQFLTEDDLTNISPEAHAYALKRFREMNYKGLYTPPAEQETLRYPSTQGGANWGGASYDPETNILYVNANEYGNTISLEEIQVPLEDSANSLLLGESLFQTNCAVCHADKGEKVLSEFPLLSTISSKYTKTQMLEIINKGKGRMPAFPNLDEQQKNNIIQYLYERDQNGDLRIANEKLTENRFISGYKVKFAYNHFIDEEGYFATKPPWGTLNAINLTTGKILWKVPLGEYEELTKRGIPVTGTKNYGGSIVTAGGLVFIAGTSDKKIRAFDKSTGEVLWAFDLPAPGGATPATYAINGKQYLVIAATGGRVDDNTRSKAETSDTFIVFSLP